jgi:hypothetical protein
MKKALKIAAGLTLSLAALVLLLLLTHPLWIGAVAKTLAERKVPEMTGTSFALDACALNAYSGTLHLEKLLLSNPDGFKQAAAVRLGALDIRLDTGSVFSDTVVIREIALNEAFVSYATRKGKSNFELIAEQAQASTGGSDRTPPPASAPAGDDGAATDASAGKKVIIDRVIVSGSKIQWEMVTIPLPTIVVSDIGRKEKGVTWAVAGNELLNAILKNAKGLGGDLQKLGVHLAETGVQAVSNSISGVAGALRAGAAEAVSKTETSAGAVTRAVDTGARNLAGAATNSVGLVFKTLKEGVSAAEDGSKSVLDATGDVIKGGRDALKEGRDALKNLFKRGDK